MMDWRDVAIHAGAAVFATGLIMWAGVPHWLAVGANTAFWLIREMFQKEDWARPFKSPQSFAEWFAPSVCCLGLAAVLP